MTKYPDPLGVYELTVSPDGLGGFNVYVGHASSDYSLGMTLGGDRAALLAKQLAPNPVDRVLAARAARPPVVIPDRDLLARELFVADNWRQPTLEALAEWEYITEDQREQYTHRLADAAIAVFKAANP